MDEAGDAAVCDGDEEVFGGDGGESEEALEGLLRRDGADVEGLRVEGDVRDVALHAGRLAEEDFDVHVDRAVAEVRVLEDEALVAAGDADEGDGAAFALADGFEKRAVLLADGEHVALLCLAAPDLHRVHRLLLVVDEAEVEVGAGVLDDFGAGVGKAAGADVVDGEDGVLVAHRGAGLDDLLGAAFHFGVAALDGVEVEGLVVGAGRHGGGGAAAESDAHRGAADLDNPGAGRNRKFFDVFAADGAHAAREHDGLVVAPVAAVGGHFVGAEEAGELRASELVAEARAANWAFNHDVERGGEAGRKRQAVLLPGLLVAGDAEVGDHEAGEAGLRLRAGARGALVADFAADASRRAGEGRDGGRVVVRLDLHEEVELLARVVVALCLGVDGEGVGLEALDDAGVVLVGDECAVRVGLVRLADHAEEGGVLRLAVDDPFGVEDLVAAVLGVDLAEHDELGVGRVALRGDKGVGEILDLVGAHGEAELLVGPLDGGGAFAEDVEFAARGGREALEEVGEVGVEALGHAVEDGVARGGEVIGRKLRARGVRDDVADAALDALDFGDA